MSRAKTFIAFMLILTGTIWSMPARADVVRDNLNYICDQSVTPQKLSLTAVPSNQPIPPEPDDVRIVKLVFGANDFVNLQNAANNIGGVAMQRVGTSKTVMTCGPLAVTISSWYYDANPQAMRGALVYPLVTVRRDNTVIVDEMRIGMCEKYPTLSNDECPAKWSSSIVIEGDHAPIMTSPEIKNKTSPLKAAEK